jgi:hypothetical protein
MGVRRAGAAGARLIGTVRNRAPFGRLIWSISL